jgi:signal transduction histidine kinase
LDNYSDLSDEERKDMINQMYKTSNQTYDLVENMLNWARIQTRNIKYEPKKFDLHEFLERKFELYEKIAGNKGITLQNNLAKKLIVYADANFLETILRNLISNAIKFTPNGGTIRIASETGIDDVTISVEDSGVGMTQAQIDTLFLLDKNKSTSGTNGENGTGLGLILCKEFVESCNGTIAVKSELGKGSTFSFTVPSISTNS